MKSRTWTALEMASYLALALGAVLPALLSAGHVVGDGVDLYGTFWFYWWIRDCVEHLRDPSFTNMMFYPLGKDIFAHTGDNFLDAVLSIPFQVVFGFPRYEVWFVAALLLGNGLSFRPLARDLFSSRRAAWGATLLWMVNPYVLFECMTGRFTQAMLFFLPLAVRHFLRIGREADAAGAGRWRNPALAGLYTALQAYTYWFMGYFMALAFAWLAVVGLWRSRDRRRLALGYLVAGLVCLAVISPAGVAMARAASAGEVPGVTEGLGLLSAPKEVANNIGPDLHGYVLMETQGQPMFAYWSWGGGLLLAILLGRDRVRWMGVALLAMAFSIGPAFTTDDGHRFLMPHYLTAYNVLPFFDRLWFPYRLLSVVFFGVVWGFGALLDRAIGWLGTQPGWAARGLMWALPVSLALAGAGEQRKHLSYPLLHRDFVPPRVYSLIHDLGGALVELPMGMTRISVAWQAVHEQPVWGGMAENAPVLWPEGFEKRSKNAFIRYLRDLTRDPAAAEDRRFSQTELAAVLDDGFRWLVLDRKLVDSDIHRWAYVRRFGIEEGRNAVFRVTDALEARLGPPFAVDEELVVWDLWACCGDAVDFDAATPKGAPEGAVIPAVLPAAYADLQPTEAALTTRTWQVGDMPLYEQHLRAIGRIGEDGAATEMRRSKSTPKGQPQRPRDGATPEELGGDR